MSYSILKKRELDALEKFCRFTNSILSTCVILIGPILFSCYCWTATVFLQHLIDETELSRTSKAMDAARAEKWRNALLNIVNYVREIERCFGFVLLLFIANFLVRTTNIAFHVITTFQRSKSEGRLPFIFTSIITESAMFCALMTVATSVPNKVRLYLHTLNIRLIGKLF